MTFDMASALNTAGMAVFLEIVSKQAVGKHTSLSPLSITVLLSMLHHAAVGPTRDELARLLGFDRCERNTDVDAALSGLLGNVVAQVDGVEVCVGQGVWSSLELLGPFVEAMTSHYGARAERVDFSSPATVSAINAFVRDATRGKIPRALESLNPSTTSVLASALYFKGDWTHQFKKERTREGEWTRVDGSTKKAKLMWQSEKFAYFSNEHVQAVRLPYGKDEHLSMHVILPAAKETFADFLHQRLNAERLEKWIRKEEVTLKVDVTLPRFTLDYSVDLIPTLQALGVERCFTPGADFSAMSAAHQVVSQVFHKTVVEVNEEGTVAAAVTVAVMSRSLPRTHRFQATRPFLFVIRDERSHVNLFVGTVVDP